LEKIRILPFWIVLFIILTSAFREIAKEPTNPTYISTTGLFIIG